MGDSDVIIIQVTSADSIGNDTPQAFNTILPYPTVLDSTKEYEVCVYDIQFNDRQRVAGNPPYLSVFVNTDLTDGSTIVGSQTTNSVLWISWTHLYSDAVPVYDNVNPNLVRYYTVFYTTEKNRKWYPMANRTQLTNINVSLTLSTGAPMPYNNVDITTITFAIRERK